MEEFQPFRIAGTTDIENIHVDTLNGLKVIFWEDIEQVFPGVQHIRSGSSVVKLLRDSNQTRYRKTVQMSHSTPVWNVTTKDNQANKAWSSYYHYRIMPHCIRHYPGVVLDVVLISAANHVHVDSPMATPPANNRADTSANPPGNPPTAASTDAPAVAAATKPLAHPIASHRADASADPPADAPVTNPPAESPADAPIDALSENTYANSSTNAPIDAPTSPPFDAPVDAPINPLASSPTNPLVNHLHPTNAPIDTPTNSPINSQPDPYFPGAITDVLLTNPPSSSSAKGSEKSSSMAVAESVPTLAITAGTSIDSPTTKPCQGFQSAVMYRLDALYDQGAITQQIAREVWELQKQMNERLILIQSKTEAILNQQLELAEYPIPRLFIVLPEDLTKYDPGNWFRTKFRLHFICECGKHTESKNSKATHHLHLAKHEGYLIREPTKFFKKYGPFLLLMLELIKFGTSVAGHVVPALASLKVVELVDSVQQTVGSVTAKIDYSLECIDSQLAKVQASSPGDFAVAEPRMGMTQQDLANYLSDVEGLEGVELRQLESFLKISEEKNLLGNLYRMATPEGHVKWVCRDHYRASYQEKHVQKLRDVVKLARGEFDEQLGRIEIVLESKFAAGEFYSAVIKAKGVFELIVELRWEYTRSDLEALHDTLKESRVPVLRIDLGQFGTTLGHTAFSKLIPTSRYKALSSIIELHSMKTVHIVLPKDFAMLSSFHPKRPSHLLELSFELVAGPFGAKELVPLADALKTNSTLTALDLKDNKIGSREAQIIAEALKTNSTLTTQNLGNNMIGDNGAQSLSVAPKINSTLATLDLKGNSMRDVGTKALAEALKTNSTLTTLDLYSNGIGSDGAKALAEALKTNSTLTTLYLLNNKIGDDGAKALAEALKTNSTLTTLNLYNNKIGGDGAKALAQALITNSNLTTLNLGANSIGEIGAQAVAEALKTNSNLTILDLHSNKIGDNGAQALAEALRINSTVTTLYLWGNSIKYNGVHALWDVLKINSNLTTLDLKSNSITVKAAMALFEVLKTFSTLTSLNLQETSIGSDGAKVLAEALKTNTTLTTLNLYYNKIGDDGAKALAEALKTNATLTTLDLQDNGIGSNGAKALAEALKTNTTLTTLDLQDNGIGSNGAKALAEALKANTTLTTLNLYYNKIGGDGARGLAEALKTNTTLTTLNLYYNKIGSDGAKALAEALKTNSTVTITGVIF